MSVSRSGPLAAERTKMVEGSRMTSWRQPFNRVKQRRWTETAAGFINGSLFMPKTNMLAMI